MAKPVKVLHRHASKARPWLLGRDWPTIYRVKLDDSNLEEKHQWCSETFPAADWTTSFGSEVFYFSNLDDATLFRMKWEGSDANPPA